MEKIFNKSLLSKFFWAMVRPYIDLYMACYRACVAAVTACALHNGQASCCPIP